MKKNIYLQRFCEKAIKIENPHEIFTRKVVGRGFSALFDFNNNFNICLSSVFMKYKL